MTDLTVLSNTVGRHHGPDTRAIFAFLARLAPGSRRTMKVSLDTIALKITLGHYHAEHLEWHRLRYEQTQLIRAWLAEKYAPATANKMLSALRGVLKECWRLGQIDVEAMHRASDLAPIRGHREPKGKALSRKDCLFLLDHAGSYRNKDLIEFMLLTGMRRDEVARFTFDDVQDGAILVRGKGNKQRRIPLTQRLTCLVAGQHRLEPTKRVFNVSSSRIWQIVREASQRAHFEVTPHDLRRTFATRLLTSGVDLPTVQRLMGHSDPKTTASYDRRHENDARKAMERVFEGGL